jgi:methylmalonyl-CoA mutase N-terminal domain/subunit
MRDLERDLAAWRQRHARELGSERRASFRTSSGREVKTVYTADDVEDEDLGATLGLPGDSPYTRGSTATGYRGKLWDWEFYAGFGRAEDANARYRYLLEQGGTGGVSIALDLPTQVGLDPDHPLAVRDVGRVGVSICTVQDIVHAFDGLSLTSVGKAFTTANCIGPIACAWFLCLAEAKGERPDALTVTIQNDPLKDYVARGTQFLPVPAAVELACDVVEYCVNKRLPWLPISVSGAHMKQAGATCAEEAAFTIANGFAYLDNLQRRGVPIQDVAGRMELHFSTDMDFFEEVAKYRVIRRVWTELLDERYGVRNVPPRLHGVASGAPLCAQQPLNNLVRITMEVLAHVFGGVAQTRTACYDEALAIPTEEAVKLSIRTNQILAYETGVADTVDPLGGSYYVEALTAEMHDEVRQLLATIDDLGGAIAAVESGYFSARLAANALRHQKQVERGERIIVGMNDFIEEGTPPIEVFRVDENAAERQRAKLAAFKETRSVNAVVAALGEVRSAAREGRNSVESVIQAVRAGATVGEICDVWREVHGEWNAKAAVL